MMISSRLTFFIAVLALAALCLHACDATAAAPGSSFVDLPAPTHQLARRGVIDRVWTAIATWFRGSRAAAAARFGRFGYNVKSANAEGLKAQVTKLREAERAVRQAQRGPSVVELRTAAETAAANLKAAQFGATATADDIINLAAKKKAADAALQTAGKPLEELRATARLEKAKLAAFVKADTELATLRAAEKADLDGRLATLTNAQSAFQASKNGKSLAQLQATADKAAADSLNNVNFANPAAVDALAAEASRAKLALDNAKTLQGAVNVQEEGVRTFLSTQSPRLARMKELEIELGVQRPAPKVPASALNFPGETFDDIPL